MKKFSISLYTGYGEGLLLSTFQFSKDDLPPIPRVGEKIVFEENVYVVNDVINYFEGNHEVALVIELKGNGTDEYTVSGELPKAKTNKRKKRSVSKKAKTFERILGQGGAKTAEAEVVSGSSGDAPPPNE